MECLIYFKIKNKHGLNSKSIIRKAGLALNNLRQNKASISIHFIGDELMKTLNSRYRGKRKTTDVLSFSSEEGGDIFICLPQIKRQAKLFSVPWLEELDRMLAHGLLHLFGYNHLRKPEKEKMLARQEKLVKMMQKL